MIRGGKEVILPLVKNWVNRGARFSGRRLQREQSRFGPAVQRSLHLLVLDQQVNDLNFEEIPNTINGVVRLFLFPFLLLKHRLILL